jgi:predicted  nucleic acid-binding Zn-ribbon protein
MLGAAIETLLILQDRDTRRVGLEAQLKAVPIDISLVERDIGDEKGAIEMAKTGLRELESKKKLLETEIGSAEQTLAKYRTQQLSLKKNEEYQAMGHEIETVQGQISDMEGRELEIMFSIDVARKKFADAEGVLKRNISGHEARIRMLRERGENLATELKAAQAEVATARVPVPGDWARAYDRMAVRGLPAVVPIRGSKCGGCHLKVSGEIESAVRGKSDLAQPVCCDQCGRIVYWEG